MRNSEVKKFYSDNEKFSRNNEEFHRNRCKKNLEDVPKVHQITKPKVCQSLEAKVHIHQHRREQKRKAEIVDNRSHFRELSNTVKAVCTKKPTKSSETKIISIALVRTSSPSPDICFHCAHQHKERCCLYMHDELQDGPRYSDFKRRLETDDYRCHINVTDGVITGNASRNSLIIEDYSKLNYPAFSKSKELQAFHNLLENYRQIPLVYIRKFYYPLLRLEDLWNLFNNRNYPQFFYQLPVVMKQTVEYNLEPTADLNRPLILDQHIYFPREELSWLQYQPIYRDLSPVLSNRR